MRIIDRVAQTIEIVDRSSLCPSISLLLWPLIMSEKTLPGVPPVALHEQILVEEIDDYPLAVALVTYLTAVRVIPNQLECDRLIRNSNNRPDKLIRLLIAYLRTRLDYDRLLHVALVGRLRKGYLSELLHLEFTGELINRYTDVVLVRHEKKRQLCVNSS